jgi:hypothetical protein
MDWASALPDGSRQADFPSSTGHPDAQSLGPKRSMTQPAPELLNYEDRVEDFYDKHYDAGGCGGSQLRKPSCRESRYRFHQNTNALSSRDRLNQFSHNLGKAGRVPASRLEFGPLGHLVYTQEASRRCCHENEPACYPLAVYYPPAPPSRRSWEWRPRRAASVSTTRRPPLSRATLQPRNSIEGAGVRAQPTTKAEPVAATRGVATVTGLPCTSPTDTSTSSRLGEIFNNTTTRCSPTPAGGSRRPSGTRRSRTTVSTRRLQAVDHGDFGPTSRSSTDIRDLPGEFIHLQQRRVRAADNADFGNALGFTWPSTCARGGAGRDYTWQRPRGTQRCETATRRGGRGRPG